MLAPSQFIWKKAEVNEINNVTVLRGGAYIIMYSTLP